MLAQLRATGNWQRFKGLLGSEDHLRVKKSVGVEGARRATVESIQNEAKKRRTTAAEAKIAVGAAVAETVKESAEEI